MNMVVINKKDVYHKQIVGKKGVVLWHKEHCPKIYKPEEIKEMIQGYLKSPFHRVCPSCDTINIYHKTKRELDAEKANLEKMNRNLQRHVDKCQRDCKMILISTPRKDVPFGYIDEVTKPGQLVKVKMR